MERIESRALDQEKILRGLALLYGVTSCAAVVFYAWQKDRPQLVLALLSLGIFPILALFYKVTGFHRSAPLEICVLGYAYLAWSLGSGVNLMHILHGFDKVSHALSGTLVTILAYALYEMLGGHRANRWMAFAFCFSVNLAVAGLWEISEFVLSPITGRDMQNAVATGVGDTMWDMIVCLLGSVPVLASILKGGGEKARSLVAPAARWAEANR